MLILIARPANALHTAAPSAIRLTVGDSHVHSSSRSWGDMYAFTSAADLIGNGNSSRQVFVFRLGDYACQLGRADLLTEADPVCSDPPQPYLVQATAGPGEPDNASVNDPTINGQGIVVAFDADGSFSGGTGPAASRRQIYMKNLRTGVVTQVTNAPDGDSTRPSLNGGGGVLVFQSTASLLGGPSGVSQVYAYSLTTGTLRQLSNGNGPSSLAMASKLGDHVTFQSRAALRGDRRDTGIWQIYWYDRTTDTLFQITNGNASSQHPYIQERAPGFVFFDSAATNLPGTAGGPGTQIYAGSTRNGNLPEIFQFTYGPGDCTWPAVEPFGNRVLFIANGDLLQNGTTGNRVFSYDFNDGALFQITGRGNVDGPIGASLGTWFVTLATTNDMAGTGICGQQLYIADYYIDHYYEAGHGRLPATQLGQRPGEPPLGDPNDSCNDNDGCSTDRCENGNHCTYAPKEEGAVCGPGDLCTGVPICVEGACTPQPGLECDDNDPCTQDSCDATAGCTFTPLPPFSGLSCRVSAVNEASSRTFLGAAQKRRLKKARTALASSSQQRPKGALRRLARAERMLVRFMALLSHDLNLTPEQVDLLTSRVQELLQQITAVRNTLVAETR